MIELCGYRTTLIGRYDEKLCTKRKEKVTTKRIIYIYIYIYI